MRTLSPKDQRTLRIGGMTVLMLALLGRGVPAWYRWQRDVRVEATVAVREAAVSRATVDRAARLQHVLDTNMRTYFALEPVFVQGESVGETTASLAAIISDAATDNELQIGSMQVETDSIQGKMMIHPVVRGDATGEIDGILHFLSMLESGTPLLSIRELTMTQVSQAVADHPEILHIEFVVEALAHPDESRQRAYPQLERKTFAALMAIPSVTMYDEHILIQATDSVVANDIFHPSDQHTSVAAPVSAASLIPPERTSTPKITLVLRGMTGGPPWKAALAGIPGYPGDVVVSTGDTLSHLVVRAIRRDTVIVQNNDTTWTLTPEQ